MDFGEEGGKKQALFGVIIAVAGCWFEYGQPGSRTRIFMNPGDMVVFDAQLEHNGAAYPIGKQADNLFLRFHLYVHWKGEEDTDETDFIHFKVCVPPYHVYLLFVVVVLTFTCPPSIFSTAVVGHPARTRIPTRTTRQRRCRSNHVNA